MSDLRAVKQEDTGEWLSFRQWLQAVDSALKRACGFGRHDLPMDYGSYYEKVTVDEMVEIVLEVHGFPFDQVAQRDA